MITKAYVQYAVVFFYLFGKTKTMHQISKINISKEAKKILGFKEHEQIQIDFEAPTKLIVRYDLDISRRLCFLGIPSFTNHNENYFLTPYKRKCLMEIGCGEVAYTHYNYGLVNVKHDTKCSTVFVDIKSLDAYIKEAVSLLFVPEHHPIQDDFVLLMTVLNKLLVCYKSSLFHEQATFTQKQIEQEIEVLLSQIGCLFLPISFIGSLQSPIYFVENNAKNIGKYAIALFQEHS